MATEPFIEGREFRNWCSRFATGITIVTTELAGEAHGMTANAFVSASVDPPLVIVSIDKRARMHQLLVQSGRYGLSILSESGTMYSNHFAGRPDDTLEIPWMRAEGMPLLDDALGHLIARVVDMHEVGDHTLFIGEVEYFNYLDGRPLIFYAGGYNRLKADPKPQYHGWYDDEMFFFQSKGLDLVANSEGKGEGK